MGHGACHHRVLLVRSTKSNRTEGLPARSWDPEGCLNFQDSILSKLIQDPGIKGCKVENKRRQDCQPSFARSGNWQMIQVGRGWGGLLTEPASTYACFSALPAPPWHPTPSTWKLCNWARHNQWRGQIRSWGIGGGSEKGNLSFWISPSVWLDWTKKSAIDADKVLIKCLVVRFQIDSNSKGELSFLIWLLSWYQRRGEISVSIAAPAV